MYSRELRRRCHCERSNLHPVTHYDGDCRVASLLAMTGFDQLPRRRARLYSPTQTVEITGAIRRIWKDRPMIRRRTLMAGTAAMLAAPSIARAANAPLKFIPQSDLTILDPIATTVYTARNHGMMVFDTLFGMDSAYQIQPQMLQWLHRRGRRQALEAHPARRPALARRRARPRSRLCGLHQTVGGARRHRQPADGTHRRTGGDR